MKKIFLALVLPFLVFQCEKEDTYQQFDPNDSANVLLQLNETSRTSMPILSDVDNVLEFEVGVSRASSVDRQILIELDSEVTTVNPNSYTLVAGVVPANSFIGTVTLTGLASTNFQNGVLKFNLLGLSGDSSQNYTIQETSSIRINLFAFCEFIRDDFLGLWDADEVGYQVYPSTFTAGAGSNEIIVSGIYDYSASSLTSLTFNDSNPSNFVLELTNPTLDNYLGTDANGDVYVANLEGSFDACSQTLQIFFDPYVYAAGTENLLGSYARTEINFRRP